MSRCFRPAQINDLHKRIDSLEYRVTEIQLLLSHQAEMVASLASVYNDIIKIFYEYSSEDVEDKYMSRVMVLTDDDEFLN